MKKETKMTDAFVIMQATRLGYEIMSDSDNMAWHRKNNKVTGPFKTLDDAAYAAINEHEVDEAYGAFEKGTQKGEDS